MNIIINLVIICTIILTVTENLITINAMRILRVQGSKSLLALENENITIEFKPDAPMRYCGFYHPKGKPYFKTGFKMKKEDICSIQLLATSNDTGKWYCFSGGVAGFELMRAFEVRVGGKVAAVEKKVTTVQGGSATLACVTVNVVPTPVLFCRFEPPNNQTFSIDESVNSSNALMNKYSFAKNMSLSRGECAVTVHEVTRNDLGLWTCSAIIEDGEEYSDVIKLDFEEIDQNSAVVIIFSTLGVIVLLVLFGIGGFPWKFKLFLGITRSASAEENVHELQDMPRRAPQNLRLPRIPKVVIESPTPSD